MTAELTTLPANGDVSTWTAAEKAIVEAAGLVFTHTYGDRQGQREPAPRPVVEKFLSLSRQSGLNPLSNQIWCIGRLSKGVVEWAVQTGIDGFRLVADRSANYAGQDEAEWMTDKGEWVTAFIPKLHGGNPLAARVRVYRKDWERPAVGVAEWGAYVQTKRDGTPVDMWQRQGAGQLAKCAEALALRKAFPMDLSGLYTVDEVPPAPAEQPVVAARDWQAEFAACTTDDEVRDLLDRAEDEGLLTDKVRGLAMARYGMLDRAEQTAPMPPTPDGPAVSTPEAASDDPAADEYERMANAEFAAAVARGEAHA